MNFLIYSKEKCPYCVHAKTLMETYGHEYEEKDVVDEALKAELLEKVPNARSLPQIFTEDGKHIGGYNELCTYLNKSL